MTKQKDERDARKAGLLKHLSANPSSTRSEIAEALNYNAGTVTEYLKELILDDKVKQPGKRGCNKLYSAIEYKINWTPTLLAKMSWRQIPDRGV